MIEGTEGARVERREVMVDGVWECVISRVVIWREGEGMSQSPGKESQLARDCWDYISCFIEEMCAGMELAEKMGWIRFWAR